MSRTTLQKSKSILIHFFSGTGNTAYVVNSLKKELENRSIVVRTYFIGRDDLVSYESIDLHLFCFPIHAWSAPVNVKKYISSLSNIKDRNCAILSIGGALSISSPGFGGQAIYQVESMIRKKEGRITYTNEIYLPDNWIQFTNPPLLEEVEKLFSKANESILEVAESILNEEPHFFKVSRFHILWSAMISSLYGWIGRRALGKLFIADDNCGACGICVKNCPSNSISLKGISRQFPQWDFNCLGCNRCINLCPDKAIQMSYGRAILGILSFMSLFYFLHPMISSIVPFFPQPKSMIYQNIINYTIGIFIIAVFHILYYTLFDKILGYLQQIQPFRKFFLFNWTNSFRRYRVKGIRLGKSNSKH